MRKIYMTINAAVVSGLLGVYSPGFAEETRQKPTSNLKLGAGLVYRTSPYRGDNDTVLPIPMIFYDSKTFFLKGLIAGYHIFEQERFSLDLIAGVRTDGYDNDDSDFLKGMDDRDSSIDGGIKASHFDGWGITSVSFVNDLLGKHDGQEVNLSYAKRFVENPWALTPSGGILWQSSNLTDYYYGVKRDETKAGRPAYSVGEAWNPFFQLNLNYQIDEQWSAVAIFRYVWLDKEIQDSPIVSDEYEILLMAGLMYKF
jgi:outer membrane protein